MSILIGSLKFELQLDLLPFPNHKPLNLILAIYKGFNKMNKFKITLSTCFIKIEKIYVPKTTSSLRIDICSTLVQILNTCLSYWIKNFLSRCIQFYNHANPSYANTIF